MRTVDRVRDRGACDRGRRRAGRRQHRDQPRRATGGPHDRNLIIPIVLRRRPDHPGAAAAGDRRAAAADRDGGAVVRRRPGRQRAGLQRTSSASPAPTRRFPLFVFVFLVALGIDYNIFLMTRVREEALRHGTRRGALIGLAATGGVITSAGLVLAGTFAVLATLPLAPSPRSGSRWRSASCSTRSSSARCWSPR